MAVESAHRPAARVLARLLVNAAEASVPEPDVMSSPVVRHVHVAGHNDQVKLRFQMLRFHAV